MAELKLRPPKGIEDEVTSVGEAKFAGLKAAATKSFAKLAGVDESDISRQMASA